MAEVARLVPIEIKALINPYLVAAAEAEALQKSNMKIAFSSLNQLDYRAQKDKCYLKQCLVRNYWLLHEQKKLKSY